MGINKQGNTEKVLGADIKQLHCCPDLSIHSMNKSVTRHYINLHLILNPTELTLLNFIVFISDAINVVKYDINLLKQFDKASSRARELYAADTKIHYNTSMPSLRTTFIGLVEKGLLVPMKDKGTYMVCPALVFNSNYRLFNIKKILQDYSKAYNSQHPSESLKSMCQDIKDRYDKELDRTRVKDTLKNKKHEAKNNSNKGK
jgi:hypothetical protein